eukprot:697182-Rhodomonas_salina.1
MKERARHLDQIRPVPRLLDARPDSAEGENQRRGGGRMGDRERRKQEDEEEEKGGGGHSIETAPGGSAALRNFFCGVQFASFAADFFPKVILDDSPLRSEYARAERTGGPGRRVDRGFGQGAGRARTRAAKNPERGRANGAEHSSRLNILMESAPLLPPQHCPQRRTFALSLSTQHHTGE